MSFYVKAGDSYRYQRLVFAYCVASNFQQCCKHQHFMRVVSVELYVGWSVFIFVYGSYLKDKDNV